MAAPVAGQRRLRRTQLLKDKPPVIKMDHLSYEEALKKLEEVVSKLEEGEIPLEDSLAAFQEGIALSRYCREKLAEIEFKVDYLLKEEQQAQADDMNMPAVETGDAERE